MSFLLSLLHCSPVRLGLVSLGLVASLNASSIQYRVEELTFTSSRDYAHPFDPEEIEFQARFRGPSGEILTVPGFWNGGRTWCVRFAPPASGRWTFLTQCANQQDAGLTGRAGTLEVAPAAGPLATGLHGGILKVSGNRRFLTYQDGTPFFYLADTWWSAPSYKMPIDASQNPEIDFKVTGPHPFSWAVDTRATQGFTVIQWHGSQAMFSTEPNRDDFGSLFRMADTADLAALDYWRMMDRYFALAASKGLVVDWGVAQHATLDPVPLSKLERVFRYMVARFGAYPSVWFVTQEYNGPQGQQAERRTKVFALASYLKSIDPYRRALTLHLYPVTKADLSWDQPWADWIMVQSGHFRQPTPQSYWWIYFQKNPKPLLEAELNYEGFHDRTLTIDDRVIRESAYTAIQSGCFGFGYGASGSYSGAVNGQGQLARWGTPVPSWWDPINNTGGKFAGGWQMQWLRKCYESVDWWKLAPVPYAIPANARLLVKADAPDTFLVWYPVQAPLTRGEILQGAAATGAIYRATWFNPRTGSAVRNAGLTVTTAGQLRLPRPPDAQDWMLILRQEKDGGGVGPSGNGRPSAVAPAPW